MNYRKTDVMVVSAFVFGYVGGCDCVVLPVFFFPTTNLHYQRQGTLSLSGRKTAAQRYHSCAVENKIQETGVKQASSIRATMTYNTLAEPPLEIDVVQEPLTPGTSSPKAISLQLKAKKLSEHLPASQPSFGSGSKQW